MAKPPNYVISEGFESPHFLIVGAGVVGLSIARELSRRYEGTGITVLEKEGDVAEHASGRNSGVLHAGFYYSTDSLKARFTVDGNRQLTEYCLDKGLPINRCGKVVVAKDEDELRILYELEKRARVNGVDVKLIDGNELRDVEPNAKTYQRALYSPTTSSIEPKLVCQQVVRDLDGKVRILYNTKFIKQDEGGVITNKGKIGYKYFINAAGLYADKIAHQYGVGKRFTVIPFKGVYLKCRDNSSLKTHIYPVPNLRNPFLGVHYTKAVDGSVKIGPTSIPAFWRENYSFVKGFKLSEFLEVAYYESRMFITKPYFRRLAIDEMRKYYKRYLINQARYLTQRVDHDSYGPYLTPGIRAQLVDKKSLELEMDFKVEHNGNSTHVLNTVSPGFTCAFSFSKYVVDEVSKRLN